jgi:serine/threonine protein kinase
MQPPRVASILSLQVASALQYLHEQCVVHRDVSPRNILIQGRKAWLIDLGLAVDLKVADAETVKSAGTLGYMAPEALRGAKVHVSGDMWALGIVIYEALFGFSPFLPHELHVPSAVVQFPDPAWGLHASSEAKLALTALLEKDPTRRLSAADLLGEHAWAAPVALAEMEALLVDEYARRAADAREAAAESEETAQAGRRRGLAEWGSEGEGNGVVGPEWLTRVTAAEVREAVGCQSRGCRPLRERAVSIM